MLFGVCSGRPRSVYGAVSLRVSLAVEGTVCCPREPWIVACEHECQNPVPSALPGSHTPNQFCAGHTPVEGEVRDGGRAPAVRGDRRVQEGREGLRPDPGWPRTEDHVDGYDVGCDDQPG